MLQRSDLRQYQNRTVEFIKAKKRCALFLDMGLGKTPCTLTATVDCLNSFDVGKTLVIAPKRVARNTWPNEVNKWGHLSHLRLSVITGTLQERIAAIRKEADVYAINRENVAWLEKARDAYGKLRRLKLKADEVKVFNSKMTWLLDSIVSSKELKQRFHYNAKTLTWTITRAALDQLKLDLQEFESFHRQTDYDAYLIDESSSFKNKGSARWKALRRLSRDATYVVLMTGTPRPNSMLEIHPQMQLLDGGERLGGSQERFKHDHFVSVGNTGRKWVLKAGHEALIIDRIADVCMVLKSEDYLELPPRIDEFMELDLGEKPLAEYKQFEKEYILQTAAGERIEAISAAALSGKLLQFANGAIYDADKKVHPIHDVKIEALQEIVEEANGAPILVAYGFKHDLARLRKAFPQAVVFDDNPETENRWNRGEIEILLAHPKSAGHGLNLQDGGSVAVWFSLTWSLEEYLQFNKRLHRSGQRRDVYIKHLIAKGTIDELILSVLKVKDAGQESLLQALISHVKSTLATPLCQPDVDTATYTGTIARHSYSRPIPRSAGDVF